MKNLILLLFLFISIYTFPSNTIILLKGEYVYVKTEDNCILEFLNNSLIYRYKYTKDNMTIFLFKKTEYEYIKETIFNKLIEINNEQGN